MFPMIYRAPADVFGDAGLDDVLSVNQLFVQAGPDDVQLPEGFDLADAAFERAGPDLMITAGDGTEVVVADFFMQENPPALLGADGVVLRGALVERLAGSMAPGQIAGEIPEPGDAIGKIVNLNGEVTVIRADGTRVTLNIGDPVFQGDILETGDDGGVGLLLADGTALSMGDDARLVLDEMVYDPGTQEGSIALSVMKGVFTMVSGEISKTDPDAMQIHTPTATIGIRGTQIGLDLSNGRDLTVVLMAEADGFVGEVTVINTAGVMTLNEAYHAVTVSSYDLPPLPAPNVSVEQITSTYSSPLNYLPLQDTNANDYDVQAMMTQDLASFETAAGPADLEVESADTIEDGLASFEEAAVDDLGAAVAAAEAAAIEGLASFDLADADTLEDAAAILAGEGDFAEPGDDGFVTDAGETLTADELGSETDVVFGEELSPLTPEETILPQEPGELEATGEEETPVGEGEGEIPPTNIFDLEDEGDTFVLEPVPNTAPVAEPGSAITAEDNAYSGQLTASDLEGGVLTFALAADGAAEHGQVVVNPDGTFTYIPDPDYGGSDSFTYTVTDEDGATAVATVTMNVTPVGDAPQVAAADAVGFEDNAIALTIAANMPSTTTETLSSIIVSGVPEGALLSAGSDNGDGSWSLSADDLAGLTLTPPRDAYGTYDLQISATSSDGTTASGAFALQVRPVGDVPQVAVADISGIEDGSVTLTIAAAMPSGTDETIESILLTGLPLGAELSAGTDNGDGTWTLAQSDLAGLSLTPPLDYNGTFNVGVSVISTDGSIAAADFAVNVSPSADTPVVATTDVIGTEDSAIALTLAASMPAGTTETVDSITIAGVPDGAMLSRGTDNGDGTWTLSPDELFNLNLTPPTDFNGSFNLEVIATSTDGGTASSYLGITVEPLADIPQLAVADAAGAEDGSIALTLAASMAADTTEALYTITIEGVPEGATLNAGIDNGDGTWTLTPDLMDGLTLTPPQDYNGVFYLTAHATSTDGGTASASFGVTVTPVGDTPVLAVTDASGAEDSAIALTIAAAMPGETTETIDTITIAGVPDGAVLSAGTDNGDGTWSLSPDELSGLTLTPPADYSGAFDLDVSVTSSDGAVASSYLGVNIGAVADLPVIAAGDVSGGEDMAINLNIAAAMPAGTTETLESITVSGVPDGAVLSAGSDNGDGTWSVSVDQLSGLTLTPPVNYSGTLALAITAVSSDGGTATSAFNVAVAPVADAPTLQISDVVVTIEPGPGADIVGTNAADELYGTSGDDTIEGGRGADVIYGDSAAVPGEEDEGDAHPGRGEGHGHDEGRGHGDEHGRGDDHGRGHDDDHGHGHEQGRGHDEHGHGLGRGHDFAPGHGHDHHHGEHDDGDTDTGGDVTGDLTQAVVVALDVDAALVDLDGSEALSIEISGVPDDATLSAGTDNGDGTWTLAADDLSNLDNLTMTLPEGTPQDDFDLTVTASSTELSGGDEASSTGTINVSFAADLSGGDDVIDAGRGDDIVYAGGGDDTIVGGQGDDELYGDAGDDVIDGGQGADVIVGGAGNDILSGGDNASDTFVFHAGDGDDIVLDLGHQDVLRFEGQEFDMNNFILQSDPENDVTTITFGDDAGVSVTLNDVQAEPGEGYTVTQDGDAVIVTFDKDSID